MGDDDEFCGSCGAPNMAHATSAQPQSQGGATPQPATPSAPKGCLAQAFQDLTKTPGALMRVCQIGFLPALICAVSVLVLLVPVIGGIAAAIGFLLAYVASVCGSGFAIEWGRDISTGNDDGMKRPLLRSTSFGLGIFSSVLSGILQLIAIVPVLGVVLSAIEGVAVSAAGSYYYYGSSGLAAALLGSLGLFVLAVIASLVLKVFFQMFADIAVMHFAVTGRIESAFALHKVWDAFKHNKTKLFCASILPELLVGLVSNIVLWILTAVFGAIAAAGLYSFGYGHYSRPSGIEAILAGGGAVLVIFAVLVLFVTVFSSVFGKMLKYRAVGHWAARYASSWTDEDEDDVLTFVLPGEKKPVAAAPAADDAEPAAHEPAKAPVEAPVSVPEPSDASDTATKTTVLPEIDPNDENPFDE